MNTWYRTTKWNWDIIPVKVIKETEKCIMIGKDRHAKESWNTVYFITHEEARLYLLRRCERQIKHLQDTLDSTKEAFKKLSGGNL